jgi:membrane peptidoglycan carboxypeptidase
MKPFVYLKAFENGYTPDTVLFDLPTEFVPNNPNCPEIPNYSAPSNSRCFHPQNFEKSFEGPVSLRNALAQSMNIPAVKLLYLVGMKDALKTLSDFGVTTLSDPSRYGLSLVLGGGEIKLADLTGAYSVLAADGVKHDQQMVLEVRDSKGNILEQYQDHASEVFDPQYVREINDVLSDANARAPLYSASLGLTTFPGREVAMKTGTTNDYHDAWTFGYTPSLTVGVWAGNNDNVAMQRHGSSILAALPIWNAFMKEALTTYPPEAFERATLPNPAKPILRGDYLADYQIHSILYFVDRSDPTGPAPLNPEDDSQFRYWENGVQRWAAANLPNYALYNSGNPFNNPSSTTPGSINVSITNPVRGSYVNQNQVNVTGLITSPQGLSAVRVYVNGAVVGQFPGQYPSQYSFDYTVSIPELRSQNLLEVEGVGTDNQISKSGVVIYQGNTTAGSTP